MAEVEPCFESSFPGGIPRKVSPLGGMVETVDIVVLSANSGVRGVEDGAQRIHGLFDATNLSRTMSTASAKRVNHDVPADVLTKGLAVRHGGCWVRHSHE